MAWTLCRSVSLLAVLGPCACEPASAQSQIDASRPLFVTLAALNAAGYEADARSPSNHPLRETVRQAILAKKPPVLAEIAKFYEAHRRDTPTAELSQYISYGLCLGDAPAFTPKVDRQSLPPDALPLDGLNKLLEQLYVQADLEALWVQAQPAIEELIGRYHVPVTQAVFDANAYLRNPTSGFRGKSFHVVVDFLGAPNQVHTRSYGDDYFVVLTHAAELKVNEIKAAYLHYLLDPLSMRHTALWEKKRALGDLAGASPVLDEAYKQDFVLLGGMSLVKAVQARLSPAGQRTAQVELAMREGFILTSYFYEQLPTYEKQEQSMRLYLPQLIEGIDLSKEDKRIGQISFASERTVKTVRPARAPEPPKPTGVEKEIVEGDAAFDQRNLSGAREAYRRALKGEAPKPLHAKAYYGLARIALVEKELDQAVELFQRTLEMEPTPFVQAWSHVYLGMLAQASQEPAEARKQFQSALAIAGASEAARTAAQKGLDTMPAPKQN